MQGTGPILMHNLPNLGGLTLAGRLGTFRRRFSHEHVRMYTIAAYYTHRHEERHFEKTRSSFSLGAVEVGG
jgi:hypothetical protein